MNIFAISDLHLAGNMDKTMDMFGVRWENHWQKIKADWCRKVNDNDVVLISGDISWAMHLEDAIGDLQDIATLPGKKILIRGNHDFWWSSITKVRALGIPNMFFLQNDAIKIENFVFAGTRGWMESGSPEDKKIFAREMIRLDLTLSAAEKLMDDSSQLIVMMHYPPQSQGKTFTSFCPMLEEHAVKHCVYGHLHSCLYEEPVTANGVTYTLTSCDLLDFNLIKIANN